MKNSQLFESLRTLNEKEFREFGKFINSPYFNNRSEVIRFYEAIKKFHPDFNAEKINEEMIFKSIYPAKKYNDVLMRKVHSLVLKLFHNYIVDLKLRNDRLHYELELIDSLRERKLFNQHHRKSQNYNNFLEGSKETMEVYEYKYKSEQKLRLIYEGFASQVEKSRNSLEKLYAFFFSVILNEQLHIMNMTSDRHKQVNVELFDRIVTFLTDSEFRKRPLINLYYLMVKLKTTDQSEYFHDLVAFRNENSAKLDKEHIYNALIILLDYCLVNIGNGNSEFRKKMFELSDTLFTEDLMNEDAAEPITFTNITSNAAFLKKFYWIDKFINKYKGYLHPSDKTSLLNYSRGMVEFEKGKYTEALKLLSPLNLKWTNMKNDIKKIMIKCYYELGYFEELILQIDSYRHFVNNVNTAENMNRGNKNFIKYISRLNDCRNSNDHLSAETLKNEVERSEFFYHKEWVLSKLEEFTKL
ncbi:MAG TPA: hypothetical protein PK605_02810 [Ignavibacteria bacterium]|nr:hypothetical protein [Bacteroidota bacterium]HRJ03314.1 hypothetical protein [Ignavibacteria bacterium]HRJ84560.1 hypothetical protein [Ignavibacteria bacterium]